MKWSFPCDVSIHFNSETHEFKVYRKSILLDSCHTLSLATHIANVVIKALTI